MALANVALTNTFDEWRTRTNQIIIALDQTSSVTNLAFNKANSANLLAYNTGIGANAFTSATVAGANSYMTATVSGANTFTSRTVAGANGFMSATVSGANTIAIAAFAKANAALPTSSYTASDVLSKLITVDGAGSGLDADTVDGIQAASFLLASSYTASDVLSKLITVDGSGSGLDADTVDGYSPSTTAGALSTLVLRDGSGGYIYSNYYNSTDNSVTSGVTGVMIKQGNDFLRTGTAAAIAAFISGQTMNINGSATSATSATTFTSTSQNSQFNSIGIGTAGSGTAGEIRATNNITAYYSDMRLKLSEGNIPNALEKVKMLSGFYFRNNETAKEYGYTNDERQVGVSAQEVQAVLPEAVTAAPFDIGKDDYGNEYSKSAQNYLTVRYEKLVPLLIEAIKEQQKQIEELKKKILR